MDTELAPSTAPSAETPTESDAPAPLSRRFSVGGWRLTLAALILLLLALHPNDTAAVAALRAGDAAIAAYDYPAAVAAYQEAAAHQVWDPVPWLRLARVHLTMQENLAALQDAYAAAARAGLTPPVRAELGHAYARLGNPTLALEQWRSAAGDPLADRDTLIRAADGFYSLGVWDKAEALYSRLATAHSESVIAYRLGLLLAASQPDAARTHLTAAARDPRLAANAGIVLAALEDHPDPAYAAARLGVAFARAGEWRLAEHQLAGATERAPGYAQALAYLGLARDRLGQDGYPTLAQALALAPDDPLVHMLLGYHWKQHGLWDTARAEFERAYDLDPANAATSVEIGLSYAASGQYDVARTWLQEAVRLAPDDPAFWKLLARFHLDHALEVVSTGLPAARRAAELAPGDAEAQDLIGWGLYLTGDRDGAAAALDQALRLDPSLASIHYHLGLVYASQGNREAARRAFARAAALDPGGPVASLAEQELRR